MNLYKKALTLFFSGWLILFSWWGYGTEDDCSNERPIEQEVKTR